MEDRFEWGVKFELLSIEFRFIVKAVDEPGSDNQEAKVFFLFFFFFLSRGSCLLSELVELVVIGNGRVHGPHVLGQELGVVPKLVRTYSSRLVTW